MRFFSYYTLLFLFLLCFNSAFGNRQIDSLFIVGETFIEKSEYEKAMLPFQKLKELLEKEHNPLYFKAVFKIGYCYDYLEEIEKAMPFYQEVLDNEKAVIAIFPEVIYKIYAQIGYSKLGKKENLEVVGYLEKSIAINEKYHLLKSDAESYFVQYYTDLGNFMQALKYAKLALSADIAANNTKNIAFSYDDIGEIYFETKNYPRAYEYYKKAFDMYVLKKDSASLAHSYISMGRYYFGIEQYDEAFNWYSNALKLAEKHNPTYIGFSKSFLSEVFDKKGNYKTAIEYEKAAEKELKNYGVSKYILASQGKQGILYYKLKQYDEALKMLLPLPKQFADVGVNNANVIDVYRTIYEIYKLKKDNQNALIYHEKYIELEQKVQKTQENALKELDLEYQATEKNLEIANQKTLILEEEKRKNQWLIIALLSLLAGLIATFALVYFNKINKIKAQKKTDELKAFNYAVSHDLRMPLLNASNHLWLLEKNMSINSEDKAHFENLSFSIQRMERMIDEVLTLTQLENENMTFTQVNTKDLVKDVLSDASETIKNKEIKVEIGDLPLVKGDSILLYHIFSNLLGNAIKFSDAKKTPYIKVAARLENNLYIYSIADNGVGFDEQNQEKIFQLFSTSNHGEQNAGIGAGLFIVKKLLEKMNGKIWAKSKIGEGATFYFSLPM